MYADHSATSWPTLFPVRQQDWGNPSSAHALGRRARDALDGARRTIAAALRWDPGADLDRCILFTSGGTEGDNLVLRQPRWTFIVTSSLEHQAVFMPAQYRQDQSPRCTVLFVPSDGCGRITPAQLEETLGRVPATGSGLVSLAYVNNEVGTVADLRGLAAVIRAANARRPPAHRIWFHTDAVQAPGHVPMDMGPGSTLEHVDLVTLSAHKFYGPAGVGAVLCRDPAFPWQPLLMGGHQQHGARAGTEPTAAILAMAEALKDATSTTSFQKRIGHLRAMTARVWDTLYPFVLDGTVLPTGPEAGPERAPHHVSFCVLGAERGSVTRRLEQDGVMASSGSACTSDSTMPSHVLSTMGVPAHYIQGSVRISLGHTNRLEDVTRILCPALRRALAGRRSLTTPP